MLEGLAVGTYRIRKHEQTPIGLCSGLLNSRSEYYCANNIHMPNPVTYLLLSGDALKKKLDR